MLKLALVTTIAFLLAGCAFAPPVIDLSDSTYKVTQDTAKLRTKIASIEYRNSADDGKLVDSGLFANTVYPIRPATKTRQTVEADLRKFFSEAIVIDSQAKRSITVTVSRADSYWTLGGSTKLPLVGLAFVGGDTEFGMNLRIRFEVEEDGKVINTYNFEEAIVTQDKSTTGEAIKDSYKRLVGEYRKRLYPELELRFVRRYL